MKPETLPENVFAITPKKKLEALLKRQGLNFGSAMSIELEKGHSIRLTRKPFNGAKEIYVMDNPFTGTITGIDEDGVDVEIYFSIYRKFIFKEIKGETRLNFEDIKDVRPYDDLKSTSQDK